MTGCASSNAAGMADTQMVVPTNTFDDVATIDPGRRLVVLRPSTLHALDAVPAGDVLPLMPRIARHALARTYRQLDMRR